MGSPLARTRIDRFELLHRFAIGGMGEIFLARERGVAGFERQVVVKLLIPELAEQPDLVALFIDEARIAANLAHPNIVQIFDFGRDQGAYFLAMEYVPGENLARICARAVRDPDNPFTRELAVHVVAEMAHGLDFAHRARDSQGRPLGIVHRDVSPHNLLLSIHGDVKVMDFGIAKASNSLHRTATGVVRGKYGYMSPEQLAGEAVDVTTDVYAAGVVLWELTLMRRMWQGRDDLAILDQVRTGNVPRPTELDASYPRDLEEIVMNAIARDRTQRTSSAGALASELRGWLALHGAVIDRAALGNVVKKLFPEIDHEQPVKGEPDAEPSTASLPTPVTPTTTTVAASPAPIPLAAASEEPAPPRRRRRGAMIAFAAMVAVTGTAVTVITLRERGGSSEPSRSVAQAPTDAAQPRAVDARSLESVDAAAPAIVAGTGSGSAVVDAGSRRKPPGAKPRVTTKSPESFPPASGSAALVDVPPSAGPELGFLVVESAPWGTFSLPNRGTLTTPTKVKLPPGDYPITITFSENAGTIGGTAKVTASTTTKCRGTPAGLSCGR